MTTETPTLDRQASHEIDAAVTLLLEAHARNGEWKTGLGEALVYLSEGESEFVEMFSAAIVKLAAYCKTMSELAPMHDEDGQQLDPSAWWSFYCQGMRKRGL